ncbi:CDF family cation-efflux transporter FieF [Plesiomonas shigelloides]|uniref:CDF family cation-efflux transporter FieF n=1 Tax=Plesiomonas shigelloides TaxID=703 RepID=UPI001261E42D|nr:CDF family cation-efflux transporter FieF [Plesiomonas shigelloides]KAB7667420.1 CDF family cation-efflux transporter FieF [Plesiomonas shigelloides]
MNKEYGHWVKLAALCSTSVATLLLLVKIVAWWKTGAVSLLASVVDSLLDIAASLTNLLVIRYSLQPADEEHRFGHGKAESLAALAQSMFISGSAFFLLLQGGERLINPQPMTDPGLGMGVTVFALLVTLALLTFQRQVVRRTGSQAIKADMLHYQSDLLMNGAILLAIGLSWWGIGMADALFAVGIGCYILISAVVMGYHAVQSLLDQALPEEERAQILERVRSTPGVRGVHQLRTRRAGPTRFIQLHLELDDNLPLVDAHRIADGVEHDLMALFPGADVIIHQDPVSAVPLEMKNSAVSQIS